MRHLDRSRQYPALSGGLGRWRWLQTYDDFTSWRFKANLPTVQFYDVAVDNALPFTTSAAATQDNFSWCGPTRTKNVNGIMNSDWYVTTGGDGFRSPS